MSPATPNLIRYDGPESSPYQLLLAHGAGAGMDHEFMQHFASCLANQGIRVIRFEFPYMQKRRLDGGKRPPDRMPKLIQAFADQLQQQAAELSPSSQLFIGGKSMGGRVASLLAAESEESLPVAGIVCLGFPFHPTGKPERFRGDHLAELKQPLLILQGERDNMGNSEEIKHYPLGNSTCCHILGDGDHSFKPRIASGLTLQQNLDEAIEQVVNFMKKNLT
ncbi:MAG: alpha/beta fold hydrolase [Halopseudomonas sp.]